MSTASWQQMFDRGKAAEAQPDQRHEAGAGPDIEAEFAPPPDPREYKPWILQRGGRPAMFLDLRRFEPKTGALIGVQMSYPHLIAIDYIGDRMVALDFGARQFVIEGTGLSELPSRLQQGMVLAVQEYSALVWNRPQLNTSMVSKLISLNRSGEFRDS